MISMRPLELQGPAQGSRTYVRWETSLGQLKAQAEEITDRGAADTCVLSATDKGISVGQDGPQLPLTLGELKQAFSDIEKSDSWLTDRPQVSLYTDRNDRTHIDVPNYGGFIVADGGRVVSRSVNAW